MRSRCRLGTALIALACATAPTAATAQRSPVPEWVRHLRPVFASEASASASAVTRAEPATSAAARVMGLLERVLREARVTRYNHRTIVDERAGRYEMDCSGLVAWVLARVDREALDAIRSSRPVAAEIAATIARAPTTSPRRAWQRVERLVDARPGDVYAWRNPRWLGGLTGHTGFIAGPIEPVPGYPTLYRVRVIDSNVEGYDQDTRAPGTGGVGAGTITVSTHPTSGAIDGIVIGHLGASWVLPLDIVIGRVHGSRFELAQARSVRAGRLRAQRSPVTDERLSRDGEAR
jgi:hypothetical protein